MMDELADRESHGSNQCRRLALLITYHYPPSLESGALRPRGLSKYLPEFGWDVVVLTTAMPGHRPGRVLQSDSRDLVAEWKRRFNFHPHRALREQLPLNGSAPTRKTARILMNSGIIPTLRWFLTYPDPLKGWAPFAIAAVEQLRRERFDAIISTAPPLSCHMIGAEVKKKLTCPWIADYRDLWNTNLDTLEDRKGLIGAIQRHTERKVLAGCDALVTVSEPWAHQLSRRYPTKTICAITNGFDPDELAPPEHKLSSKFSITHTGFLYLSKRDPTPVFESLRELIDAGEIQHSDLLLRFYGNNGALLPQLVERFRLSGVTEMSAAVPREEALRLQRESQLLLILSWSGSRENGGHTGKVFEYLASRRPILASGGARGVLSDLLEQTNAGVHVFSKDEMRRTLLQAYREYKLQGRVAYRGNDRAIHLYSHRNMAQRFAKLLDSVAPRIGAEPHQGFRVPTEC